MGRAGQEKAEMAARGNPRRVYIDEEPVIRIISPRKATRSGRELYERNAAHQTRQLAALDALGDSDIDLSDIPDQGNRTGWARVSSSKLENLPR